MFSQTGLKNTFQVKYVLKYIPKYEYNFSSMYKFLGLFEKIICKLRRNGFYRIDSCLALIMQSYFF